MAQDKRASVIGGGSWGTALAHLMAASGANVRLWMRNAERVAEVNEQHTNSYYLKELPIHAGVVATTDLEEAIRFADTMIVAIPAKSFRSIAFEMGAFVTGDQILLSATKGFEAEQLKRMSQVLREETCARKIGAISGPNLADEIMAGQPTATVVASPYDEVIDAGAQLIAGPTLRVYGNYDIVGVETFGALKNIIAIAAGACTGLGLGANSLSMLLTRGLAEISRFAERHGSDRLTSIGLAGIGDLIATCSSPLSRNNSLGRKLAEGLSLDGALATMHKVAEGVNTTNAVHMHAERLGVDMPIARGVYQVLFGGEKVSDVLGTLMSRANRYEHTERPIDEPEPISGSVVETALAVTGRRQG